MTEPIRVSSQIINIVAGDRLRPGDIISARITGSLPGNRFRILWNGRQFTAQSQLSFTKGQLIRARVETGPSGTTLRLLQDSSGAGYPAAARGTSLSRILEAAFLRAALPLPPEGELKNMAALLFRSRGRRTRLARLYADLQSRGAYPSADFLEALDEALSAGRGGTQQRGRGDEQQRQNQAPDSEKVKEEFMEADDSLLSLVNSAESRGDRWVYKRLAGLPEDPGISLAMKFRQGSRPAMALTVHDGERTLEFLLEGLHPGRMAVYSDNEHQVDEKTWNNFRQRLSLMNIQVDDTLYDMESSDGFTHEFPEGPERPGESL